MRKSIWSPIKFSTTSRSTDLKSYFLLLNCLYCCVDSRSNGGKHSSNQKNLDLPSYLNGVELDLILIYLPRRHFCKCKSQHIMPRKRRTATGFSYELVSFLTTLAPLGNAEFSMFDTYFQVEPLVRTTRPKRQWLRIGGKLEWWWKLGFWSPFPMVAVGKVFLVWLISWGFFLTGEP